MPIFNSYLQFLLIQSVVELASQAKLSGIGAYRADLQFFQFYQRKVLLTQHQCCGSELDPDSIRPVDPGPDSESGSRRANITHKSSKIL